MVVRDDGEGEPKYECMNCTELLGICFMGKSKVYFYWFQGDTQTVHA